MHPKPKVIRFLRTYGMSIWCSFLSAGIASVLFFATFDPRVLVENATFPYPLSREAAYTLGFFLFWILLILNSFLVLMLAQGANRERG